MPDVPLVLAAARAEPPDLILLDIKMPGMNGYEVCERLKAGVNTCDIPIIFISVLGEVGGKVQAFAVGGVDYVTKPFQFEEVLARVETHLALRALQKQLQETNRELARRLEELQEALTTVKTLRGLIPICASCKKIRDDQGYWNQLETYIAEHSDAEFSHGICPDCAKELYPEIYGDDE